MTKIPLPNILIVDDRDENLIALEALLEDFQSEVIRANSGNDALAELLETEVALVLLDVQMPGMDGFEVAEIMRSNERTRHIPIIFVTAISKEQEYVFKGYESGAVDYLFKPLDPQILQSKVRVFLELASQQAKLKHFGNLLEYKNQELVQHKSNLELLVQERTLKLQEAKEEAEMSNRARSKFLSNMTHELRTPLHAINGFSTLAIRLCKKDEIDKDKLLQHCERIKTSGERLQTLVDDLLMLSELSSVKSTYKMVWGSLFEIAQVVQKTLQHQFHEKQIKFNMAMPSFDTRSCFDEGRISQVFHSLLENAVNYSGVGANVNIVFEQLDEGVKMPSFKVTISDEGIGIPDSELESIFEAFTLGSHTDTGAGGRGLGLALSREIIEAHEGKIWAENREHKGSKIVFVFPILDEHTYDNRKPPTVG